MMKMFLFLRFPIFLICQCFNVGIFSIMSNVSQLSEFVLHSCSTCGGGLIKTGHLPRMVLHRRILLPRRLAAIVRSLSFFTSIFRLKFITLFMNNYILVVLVQYVAKMTTKQLEFLHLLSCTLSITAAPPPAPK